MKDWKPISMRTIVRAEQRGFTWQRDPARSGWRALQSPSGQTWQIIFQPLRRRRIEPRRFAEAA